MTREMFLSGEVSPDDVKKEDLELFVIAEGLDIDSLPRSKSDAIRLIRSVIEGEDDAESIDQLDAASDAIDDPEEESEESEEEEEEEEESSWLKARKGQIDKEKAQRDRLGKTLEQIAEGGSSWHKSRVGK